MFPDAPASHGTILYRRSPHLVAYWSDSSLVFYNYATNKRIAGTALTIGLLDFFADWTGLDLLFARSRVSRRTLRTAVRDLAKCGLLQRSDRAPQPREAALETWRSWNPSAGFFHSASRDCDFAGGESRADEFLRQRLATTPQPAPLKNYAGCVHLPLPPMVSDGVFAKVLLERRTWRTFGKTGANSQELATLLGLTYGVQKWLDQGALGRAMLRTSPSGGARHPIEAYVLARKVSGIPAGLYYYAPEAHRLALLRPRVGAAQIRQYLPGQPWYASASVLIIMTAVFPRTEWQYPFPRAYRIVLLEAGHFCQTFCLVATALGLAPFCTAALADSLIERDLGIDGVTESVVYACGVGSRPPGVDWAPWPDTTEVPTLLLPKSAPNGTDGGPKRPALLQRR